MSLFTKMSDAAGLVSGMAERLDVDLAAQMQNNPQAGTRSYRAMVMRCANCSDQEGCARLQEENPMLDEAPSYCMNRDVLHRD